MKYLLDTNVVSELVKENPDKRVAEWFSKLDSESTYISVITLGEIRKGIESMPAGKRREKFSRWLEWDLSVNYEGRILDIDRKTAELWGSLSAKTKRSLPTFDALMAATALAHKLKMVTRNTDDFEYPGLSVINPWN